MTRCVLVVDECSGGAIATAHAGILSGAVAGAPVIETNNYYP